jgi:hypothetical protein
MKRTLVRLGTTAMHFASLSKDDRTSFRDWTSVLAEGHFDHAALEYGITSISYADGLLAK